MGKLRPVILRLLGTLMVEAQESEAAYKELAIQALQQMKGDNTARAKIAFRNCTPEQMQQEYGHSGQTRAQIIAEYEEHDAKVQAAIEWVKAQ